MKKILYIIGFVFFSFSSFAQDEDGGKLHQKMTEYIEKKLGMSREESERFSPVFLEYFKELKNTNRQYKDDRLVLQQKIVELRLKYRDQFKPIIGEKRSNDVFTYERAFVKEVQEIRNERRGNRLEGPATRRKNLKLQ